MLLIDLYKIIFLSRVVVPTIQGYEDAGDFTMAERLKTSIHANLVFYLCVGTIGLFGLVLLILLRRNWFASYLANMFLFLSLSLTVNPFFFNAILFLLLQYLSSFNCPQMTFILRRIYMFKSHASENG